MDIEQYQWMAEAISLALTIPTIILGIGVLIHWGPAAWEMFKAKSLDSNGWLIVGVVVAFLGSVLDNLYWSIPWASSFLSIGPTDALMENGVFFNIFFRQLSGIAAAYCHLKASVLSSSDGARKVNQLVAVSYIMAVALVTVLFLYKAA